jgi:hypothetical protein
MQLGACSSACALAAGLASPPEHVGTKVGCECGLVCSSSGNLHIVLCCVCLCETSLWALVTLRLSPVDCASHPQ